MTRQEILDIINRIILEEHGNVLTEEDLLKDSNLDSFGYAIFWLTLCSEVGSEIPKNVDDEINYDIFTVNDAISLVTKYKK